MGWFVCRFLVWGQKEAVTCVFRRALGGVKRGYIEDFYYGYA